MINWVLQSFDLSRANCISLELSFIYATFNRITSRGQRALTDCAALWCGRFTVGRAGIVTLEEIVLINLSDYESVYGGTI